MLTSVTIAQLRLQNQQILRSRFDSVRDLVAWHGAKQAQEYTHAKWAIGLRLPGATNESIEQAIHAGDIVRTHILRPTWHFVSSVDIRWMMRLTAPQIALQGKARERELGLDAETFKRTNNLIVKALEGGQQRTRKELAEVIDRAGIPTDTHRMVHIMFRAELDLLVCNGSPRGKEQTYALLDERVPPGPRFEGEEALAELARRYFTSHAPATIQDFTWWSGLKAGDARKALDSIKGDLKSMPLDNLTYWMPKELEMPAQVEPSVHLLPAFDEFMVSYKERGASLEPSHTALAITGNGIFKPIVVRNGRVEGIWSRTEKKNAVAIDCQLFRKPGNADKESLAAAAARFGKFLGKEIEMAW